MGFTGLTIGASGLVAAQRRLETAAHNIANANTDGYSRQRVEAVAAAPLVQHRGIFGPGAAGQGVSIEAVSRASDTLVAATHRESVAQAGSWTTRADFYAQAETILGPLGSGTTQAMSDFWNSWESLSQSPDSITSRNIVIDAASQVVNSINGAVQRVDGLLADLNNAQHATTTQVNDLAQSVALLNAQIKDASVGANAPNDLLDKRDVALAELARLTGASSHIEADGDARVTINGMALVDGAHSYAIESSGPPPALSWSVDGSPVAARGQLGSIFELATTGVATIMSQLDDIALQLTDLVNTTHAGGFDLDGAAGGDFFAATGARDLSLAAGINARTIAASASGEPTDGNHALVMGDLRTQGTSSGSTVDQLVNALQGHLGVEAATSARQAQFADVVVGGVEAKIADISGVSTDEELTDMLQYQRAFEAAARVITVMDSMLDKLINGTGTTR